MLAQACVCVCAHAGMRVRTHACGRAYMRLPAPTQQQCGRQAGGSGVDSSRHPMHTQPRGTFMCPQPFHGHAHVLPFTWHVHTPAPSRTQVASWVEMLSTNVLGTAMAIKAVAQVRAWSACACSGTRKHRHTQPLVAALVPRAVAAASLAPPCMPPRASAPRGPRLPFTPAPLHGLQDMRRRGQWGHIINMVGLSGHRIPDGPQGGGFYCATKSAVRTITEGLRQEVRVAWGRLGLVRGEAH